MTFRAVLLRVVSTSGKVSWIESSVAPQPGMYAGSFPSEAEARRVAAAVDRIKAAAAREGFSLSSCIGRLLTNTSPLRRRRISGDNLPETE